MRLFNLMDTAFENYDETIQTYLTKVFAQYGIQYSNNHIYSILMTAIKGVIQNAMFYIEDAFTEQNIETATRKKSVFSLAKISGYEPYYGSAATGTLIGQSVIHNTTSKTTKIYINNYSIVQNKDTGESYLLILPTNNYTFDITKPLVKHEFKIVHGSLFKASYVFNGFNFETFEIYSPNSWDKEYLKVTVNGEEWEQAASLYDMHEDTKGFIVNNGYNGTFQIMFGNGIYGLKPSEGDSILVEYITHKGELGNITNKESANFVFVSSGKDTMQNNVNLNDYMKLYLKNNVTGGNNPDSIDFVKHMVGYNSRSLVLANEKNFKLFLKRFSFIGICNVWSEKNSMNITISALSNIMSNLSSLDDYYSLNINNMVLTKEQKDLIVTTLNNSNNVFAGVTVTFKDPIIRKYAIVCYVKLKSNYNKDTAKQSISNIIGKFFMKLDSNVSFIAKSSIIKAVLDEDNEIESFDINIISELEESCFYKGYYTKYDLKFYNDTYIFKENKVLYSNANSPGLDMYGNIKLDSKLEIPYLNGGFRYYPDKSSTTKLNKDNCLTVPTIQYFFI